MLSGGIEPPLQVPETCVPRLPSPMPPRGIEPPSQVPETCTLSIELQGLRLWRAGIRCPPRAGPLLAETMRAHSSSPIKEDKETS